MLCAHRGGTKAPPYSHRGVSTSTITTIQSPCHPLNHTENICIFCNFPEFFSKTPLTNPKKRRIMGDNKIHKGGAVMFTNMFYYFYFFNMGCPSFVIPEK